MSAIGPQTKDGPAPSLSKKIKCRKERRDFCIDAELLFFSLKSPTRKILSNI